MLLEMRMGNRFPWNYNSVDEAQRAIDDYYVAGQGTRSISMAEFGGNKDMLQFGGGGFRSSYDEMIPQAMKDALKKSKQQGKIEEIAIKREKGDRPFTQHLESILADGEEGPEFYRYDIRRYRIKCTGRGIPTAYLKY